MDKELRIYSIKQNNTITQRKAVSKRKQFFYIIYKFYVRQETKPHCSLTIIPEEEENILPKRFEYEGNSIILNRENTEMSNRTITSKEQAEIVFDDGHWYLLDRSMLQTTYIQVNRKIEIIPDDIIVLGDRRFKFECD